MSDKPKTISQFLNNHLWQILVFIGGFIVIFSALRAEVTANAREIIEIKEKQATYPSQEWFELKFETIERSSELRFQALEKKIEEHSFK